jgi:hypothetical protein
MNIAPVLDVAELDLVVEPYDWPFARERAEEIAAHWEARRTEKPALFDGRVLLMFRHAFELRADGRLALRGAYFETAYSNFLAWRDFGFRDPAICNGFSMAALQSADGAYLLGEMADHTATAGQVYFAAGTPDLSDVFGTCVDLEASVKRELLEETGLNPAETRFGAGWRVVHAPPLIACMKVMRLPIEADVAKRRIETFLASETRPELAAVHIVRRLEDLDGLKTPAFMRAFLAEALAEA